MAGHNVSAVREAVVCLCLFSVVMQFISIIGTEWAVPPSVGTGEGSDSFQGVGLWRYCFRKEDPPGSDTFQYVCNDLVGSGVPGWMSGVQAVLLLAVIFYAVAFLLIITFTCCGSRRHDKRLLIAFIALETVAGIFNLTGVVLFSDKVHTTFEPDLGLLQLAWCFILNCISDALAALAVIIAVIEFATSKPDIPMERFVNEMNAPTSAVPPSDNAVNQSYQNSEAPSAMGDDQIIPGNQVTMDPPESNA